MSVNRLNPEEKIPPPLALGLALQIAGLTLPGIVLIPTIVFRAAGESEAVLLWAVFASLVVCGATTTLQALRFGRLGAGHILLTGTSGAAIAVSIAALDAGGPPMLATLVAALALFQLAFSARLSLFRRILTPTVTGTVIMLTPVTVMPHVFELLRDVPAEAPPVGAPLSALTTLLVISCIVLKAGGTLRLWAPVIGICAGAAVSGVFGLYDFDLISRASWIGIPAAAWPGFDLDFGPEFWGLLPAYLFIALICTIQTISGSVAVQRVSSAAPRAVDFRRVQGAAAADGIGNLLSGMAGSMPVGFRPHGASMVEITGISSRYVGVTLGAVLIVLSCLPKALAVILAIPGPVAAAFIAITMATIFIVGMKIIVQDGIDYRKGLIAGVSFWLGTGFQNGVVYPELLSGFAGGLLQNGMMAGGIAALVLTAFAELTKPRPRRVEVEFDISSFREIQDFIGAFARRGGWDEAMAERLHAAGEETLLTLLDRDAGDDEQGERRLLLVARKEDKSAILEFVASKGDENLQDRIAFLDEADAVNANEREVSLRLLRHLASSVRHQQYHGMDIVTVRVEPPGAASPGRP